jgi:trimeric autotransporter adhesin
MWRRTLLCLLACLSVGALKAQVSTAGLVPGPAVVGVPYSFDFANFFNQFFAQAPPGFFYNFALVGGTLPPGLTLANSEINGTPAEPGNFTFNVALTFGATVNGVTVSFGPFPFPASVDVTGNSGPAVAVSPGSLTFSFSQGSTSAATQSIAIINNGTSAQNFTASSAVNSGGNWLSVSPAAGAAAPVSTSSVTVSANPSGLAAGTYLGTVSIASANQTFNIAITLTVSSGAAELELSQTGFRFQTVAGGAPPAQTLSILNSGSKSSNFGASASTTSGGQWLSVSPASGTISASAPATATISIQASGLAAGDYYGQIQVSAGGAENSPQTASVVLNVATAGTDLGAFISPTGLIFVGQAGGASLAAQTISVTNPSTSTLTFSAGTYFAQTTPWFTVQPATASVSAASPATIAVQPVAGLAAGIYAGDIQLHFTDDSTSTIAVLLVVIPANAVSDAHAVHAASTCAPTKLLPVFTELGANFSTVAAWPTPVQVTVVDDCGNFLTAGSVTASFSDGDPPLPLTSLNNGSWSATWQPRNSSAQVVITADALEAAPALQGTQSIGGSLQSNPTTPSINAGGVVSAAKSVANPPLAPGGLTSIYGVNLSAGQNPALSLPLATELGATQVILGGRLLPLQYANNGQVNAVIPYDVPANTTQQLIISNGPALSVPEPVVIAPAQPAVFAQSDGSGVVFDVKPGTTAQILVNVENPMSAGDAIVIYCAGLGPVTPNVAAGSAAPSSPPATTTNPAAVTIGGKSAQVFFNGLVGGFAGLYQVNAYVPKGITPGNAVPLVISVAGFESAPVTVAVK